MTISRSRIESESSRPSSYRPHEPIASAIGMFLAKARNKPIGATPGGIIPVSSSATSSG